MTITAGSDVTTIDYGQSKRAWDAVLITAGSARQEARYQEQIQRRQMAGTLTEETRFLVVPDVGHKRIGSGGLL